MNTLLTILVFTLFAIHILLGNYLYPLKEGIVKGDKFYYLYKWHLVLGFIPAKLWYYYGGRGMVSYLGSFTIGIDDAQAFYHLDEAKECLTSSRKKYNKNGHLQEVYNTWERQVIDLELEEFNKWKELRNTQMTDELLKIHKDDSSRV